MRYKFLGALLLGALTIAFGQTRADLRASIRNLVLVSGSASRPFVMGSIVPTTCAVGETFFKKDAIAGQNLYICSATDTWSAIAGLDGTGKVLRSTLPVIPLDQSSAVSGVLGAANGGTGLSSGVAGGIPYFSGASSMTSSPALTANAVVFGGGAGAAPSTAGNITVQSAGANGTELANAGDNNSLARSDHEHLVPWQIGIPFTGTPPTGDFSVRLPIPATCGGGISVNSVRVVASNKGTGPMTAQVFSCTNGANEACSSLFASGSFSYSNTGSVSQIFNTDQNNTGLASTGFFKVSLATVNNQAGVAIIVNGSCKNI